MLNDIILRVCIISTTRTPEKTITVARDMWNYFIPTRSGDKKTQFTKSWNFPVERTSDGAQYNAVRLTRSYHDYIAGPTSKMCNSPDGAPYAVRKWYMRNNASYHKHSRMLPLVLALVLALVLPLVLYRRRLGAVCAFAKDTRRNISERYEVDPVE